MEPRYIIAVAAGKGGVGKSTVTVHLACALKQAGFAVGILDADLYGPSLGRMMPQEESFFLQGDKLIPGECLGVKVFSVGYVKSEEDSMSVRAPIANGWIEQCVKNIDWGELDYLFVDFPPGTGDIPLTLTQEMTFFGALLVTTPQMVSVLDVKKAANLFHQTAVPILGVIENMSYFGESKPFGEGGAKALSDFLGVDCLLQIPLDPILCQCADKGEVRITQFWQDFAKAFSDLVFEKEVLWESCLKEFVLTWEDR